MHVLFIKQSDIGHILRKPTYQRVFFSQPSPGIQTVCEYDQEMPLSQTADQSTAP